MAASQLREVGCIRYASCLLAWREGGEAATVLLSREGQVSPPRWLQQYSGPCATVARACFLHLPWYALLSSWQLASTCSISDGLDSLPTPAFQP